MQNLKINNWKFTENWKLKIAQSCEAFGEAWKNLLCHAGKILIPVIIVIFIIPTASAQSLACIQTATNCTLSLNPSQITGYQSTQPIFLSFQFDPSQVSPLLGSNNLPAGSITETLPNGDTLYVNPNDTWLLRLVNGGPTVLFFRSASAPLQLFEFAPVGNTQLSQVTLELLSVNFNGNPSPLTSPLTFIPPILQTPPSQTQTPPVVQQPTPTQQGNPPVGTGSAPVGTPGTSGGSFTPFVANIIPTSSQVRNNLPCFPDLTPSDPTESICFLKEKGIIKGYPDGTFKPKLLINRAEFSKMIALLALDEKNQIYNQNNHVQNIFKKFYPGFASPKGKRQLAGFSDVLQGDWFAPFTHYLRMQRVIGGYPDGTFKPGSFINKAEAAKIVVGDFAYTINENEDNFIANFVKNYPNQNPWYAPWVAFVQSQIPHSSATRGASIPNIKFNTLSANASINRATFAELIHNMILWQNNQ
jgi:hypothetical protein